MDRTRYDLLNERSRLIDAWWRAWDADDTERASELKEQIRELDRQIEAKREARLP